MFLMSYMYMAAGVKLHTQNSACQIHTHSSVTPSLIVHLSVSNALTVIDCELHATEFPLICSARLRFSNERCVQFSIKIYCDE